MKFFKLPDALNKRGIASKWKKFTSGFTLVELVVVIAILAILSGIGVLGYNGYIEYAQRAADEELIAAVNTAFSAACEENGVAFSELEDGAVLISFSSNCVTGISQVKGLSTDALNALDDSFCSYYSGNEKTPLKYFKGLTFKKGEGFKGSDTLTIGLRNGARMSVKDNPDGTRTFTVVDGAGNELVYNLKVEDLEKFAGSTFDRSMSASELMGEVDNVAKAVDSLVQGLGSMGDQIAAQFAAQAGFTYDPSDPERGKKFGNALVLMVAENSVSEDFDAHTTADSWVSSGFEGNVLGDTAGFAMGYAMATAFANSEFGQQTGNYGGEEMTAAEYYQKKTQELNSASGMQSLTIIQEMLDNMINSDKYKEYYAANGSADVDGYLGAMGVITDSKETLKDGNHVLDNAEGFAGEDIGAILDGIFGG